MPHPPSTVPNHPCFEVQEVKRVSSLLSDAALKQTAITEISVFPGKLHQCVFLPPRLMTGTPPLACRGREAAQGMGTYLCDCQWSFCGPQGDFAPRESACDGGRRE